MAESYTKRIRDYCESAGIAIPIGFGRHPANRYAAVDTSQVPPQLVAATWFKQADLLYFVQRHPQPASLRLLDFKDRKEMVLRGTALAPTGDIS